MTNTATPPQLTSLDDIADRYEGILCDVWGVLHNGVTAFETAHPALRRFREAFGGSVVLVTNAPRPNGPVFDQLLALGIHEKSFDAIVTSGDVTLLAINKTPGNHVYHIGPERDLGLFEGLDLHFVGPQKADKIVCTGLFDDITETPEDYRAQLTALADRSLPFICANPDLVVHRGNQEIYCAGALAQLYADLGGPVALNGKPHAPIYDAAMAELEAAAGKPLARRQVLAIGDAFRTDVRGAVDAGFDCLLITSGIHHQAFGPIDVPASDRVHAELAAAELGAVGFMPWLG